MICRAATRCLLGIDQKLSVYLVEELVIGVALVLVVFAFDCARTHVGIVDLAQRSVELPLRVAERASALMSIVLSGGCRMFKQCEYLRERSAARQARMMSQNRSEASNVIAEPAYVIASLIP